MINCARSFFPNSQYPVKRFFLPGMLSTLAILAGWVPLLSGHFFNALDGKAYAQEDQAFTRYVKSAVEIEKTRQRLLDEVKQLTGGNLPSNVCQPNTVAQIDPLPRERVRNICDDFSTQAIQIVDRNGLSRDEFNRYQKQARDITMRTQIEAEIRRLRLR
jgi:hypothetical protein